MTGMTAALVMQVMLLSPHTQTYQQAYANSTETGRPLLIMIGAPWCPACVTMKQTTLPTMIKDGDLAGVEFTMIDASTDESLASQLMTSTSIPQLILFEPQTGGGWKRSQLIGSQSSSRIKAMIGPAVSRTSSVVKPVSARMN